MTLRERLESRIEEYPGMRPLCDSSSWLVLLRIGQLMRACVELAKDWRTDKYLRKLDAMMIVSDHEVLLATPDVPTQACMDCCCACCLATEKRRAEILISGHLYAHWKWRCFRACGWCSGFYGRLASLVAAHHVCGSYSYWIRWVVCTGGCTCTDWSAQWDIRPSLHESDWWWFADMSAEEIARKSMLIASDL